MAHRIPTLTAHLGRKGEDKMSDETRRVWDVGGAIPPKSNGNERAWAKTLVVHVVADCAKRAIELVELKYPGITVHTVQHRGALDIIEDGEP